MTNQREGYVPETHLGQIKVDGAWMDYARGHREESIRWAKGDPENRRVVDWIRKEQIIWPEPTAVDNTMLVYFLTERTETSTSVDVEVVIGEGDDASAEALTVDDSEPLDVYGLIFSRIFDELGYALSDPGDFSWERVPLDDEAYLVTINCDFTTED